MKEKENYDMTNRDHQSQPPLSSQEGSQELEEQQLDKVTGTGGGNYPSHLLPHLQTPLLSLEEQSSVEKYYKAANEEKLPKPDSTAYHPPQRKVYVNGSIHYVENMKDWDSTREWNSKRGK